MSEEGREVLQGLGLVKCENRDWEFRPMPPSLESKTDLQEVGVEGTTHVVPPPLPNTGTSGSVGPRSGFLSSRLPGPRGLGAVPGRERPQWCNHSGKRP